MRDVKTSFYNVSRKSINHLWFVNFNAWHYSFPEATSYDKSKEASSLFQSEMIAKLEKRHKKLHVHVYHKTKTKHKLSHINLGNDKQCKNINIIMRSAVAQ